MEEINDCTLGYIMEINILNQKLDNLNRWQKTLFSAILAPFLMALMFCLAILMVGLGIFMLTLPIIVFFNPKSLIIK